MLSFVQNLKDFLKGFSLCRIFVHVHTCTRHKHKGPGAYLKARIIFVSSWKARGLLSVLVVWVKNTTPLIVIQGFTVNNEDSVSECH